jgi:hypothetical protein
VCKPLACASASEALEGMQREWEKGMGVAGLRRAAFTVKYRCLHHGMFAWHATPRASTNTDCPAVTDSEPRISNNPVQCASSAVVSLGDVHPRQRAGCTSLAGWVFGRRCHAWVHGSMQVGRSRRAGAQLGPPHACKTSARRLAAWRGCWH